MGTDDSRTTQRQLPVGRDDDAAERTDPSILAARTRVGQVLRDKYHLDQVLGVGGMAAVYVATHRNKKRFAVKMLHPELSSRADIRARFLREGYAANSVEHAGAVAVLDEDIAEDGSAFLVMELLDGDSVEALTERAPGGRLPLETVLNLSHQLLDVLAAAHAHGIVHRDIKPANLFLLRDGRLKVLDFGIARVRDVTAPSATQTGAAMGTPAYMAPEQALGETGRVDGRTDVWAVGATMFSLASGRTVHEGATTQQVMIRAATQPAMSLAAVLPDAPPAVVEVVDRALAFDPQGRWPTASAMRDAIRDAALIAFGRLPTLAPEASDPGLMRTLLPEVSRTSNAAAPSFSKASGGALPRASGRRRRWPWVLGALLMFGGAAAAWRGLRSRDSSGLPAQERRVAFLAENRGDGGDAWLARPLELMAAHRLDAQDAHVRGLEDVGSANVIVRVGYRSGRDKIILDATVGPRNGDKTQLTPPEGVRADTVAAALDRVLALVMEQVDNGQPARGPDAEEAARMRSLGAPSYDAWRGYQALLRATLVGDSDPDKYVPMARDLVRAYPGWARPSVALAYDLIGAGEAPAEASSVLSAARQSVRDDEGLRLIAAADAYLAKRYEEVVGLLMPTYASDPMMGLILFDVLGRLERTQDEVGVLQRLNEAFPRLQFGELLQEALRGSRRSEEATKAQAAWLQAAPDSADALGAQINLDLEVEDQPGAVRDVRRLITLFGAGGRLGWLADVQTATGQLDEAAVTANSMIGASGRLRADGLLRLGRIDILKGRLSSARQDLERAAVEGKAFGIQGPWQAAMDERVELLRLDAASDEVERVLAQGNQSPAVELERRLLKTGACPTPQERGKWADGEGAPTWRHTLRAAAAARCAPCAQVVRAGADPSEFSQRSLYLFGLCAESEGALDLAREAFATTKRFWNDATKPDARTSTVAAVLARLHLARVLARLGLTSEARASYEDFLRYWGHPDRPLPELAAARKELAGLGGPSER